MNSHQPTLRSLILLGGHSSRMGTPKYLLQIPSTVSESGEDTPFLIHALYLHHMFQVMHGDPILRSVVLSVRDEAQRNEIKALIARYEKELPMDLNVNYVQDIQKETGPAAGLVAAWRLDSIAHWLVTGCDFPMIAKTTLQELRKHHHKGNRTVTCFINAKGYSEPLLAIWTPIALSYLSRLFEQHGTVELDDALNSLEEKKDPKRVTDRNYAQGVSRVQATNENWITSVNCQEEWQRVEEHMKHEFAHSDP